MSASENTPPANDARDLHDDHSALRRWLQAGALAAGLGTAAIFGPGAPIALADDTSATADSSDGDAPDGPAASPGTEAALTNSRSDSDPAAKAGAQRPPRSTLTAQGVVTTMRSGNRSGDIDNLSSRIRAALQDITDVTAPSRPRPTDRQNGDNQPAVSLALPTRPGILPLPETRSGSTVKSRRFGAESLTTPPTPLKAVVAAVSERQAITRLTERRAIPDQTAGAATPFAAAPFAVNEANPPSARAAAKPYPPAVTAPVSVNSIVTDILGWTRPGTPAPTLPLPTTPLNDLLAGAWIAVRRAHYTFFNSAPTATPAVVRRNPDTGEVIGSLGGDDADGDVLTYGIVTDAKNGKVELHDDGTYTYTPSTQLAHSGGVDSVTFSIDDAAANPWHVHGLRGLFGPEQPTTVTVDIVVPKVVNKAPAAPTAVEGAEPDSDGTVMGTIDATDANKDPLSYEVTSEPEHGTVTLDGNTYTYKPTADARHAAAADDAKPEDTTDTFDITTADGYGGTVVTTVTVDIKPKNTAPTVTDVVVQTTPLTYQRVFISGDANSSIFVSTGVVELKPVNIRDDDTDPVTVTATIKNPKWGVVTTGADGTITYTPNSTALGDIGNDFAANTPKQLTEVITFTFDDGHGGVTTKDVTVNLNDYAQPYLLFSGSIQLQQIDLSALSEAQPELKVSDLPGFIDELPLQDARIIKRGDRVVFKTTDGVEYDLGPASSFNRIAIANPTNEDDPIVVSTYLNSSLQTFLFIGKKTTDSP